MEAHEATGAPMARVVLRGAAGSVGERGGLAEEGNTRPAAQGVGAAWAAACLEGTGEVGHLVAEATAPAAAVLAAQAAPEAAAAAAAEA